MTKSKKLKLNKISIYNFDSVLNPKDQKAVKGGYPGSWEPGLCTIYTYTCYSVCRCGGAGSIGCGQDVIE